MEVERYAILKLVKSNKQAHARARVRVYRQTRYSPYRMSVREKKVIIFGWKKMILK